MATKAQKRAAERRAQKASEKAAAKQKAANQQKADNKGKGKPKISITPPPGWYDPNLDSQKRASKRGIEDLREDIDAKTGTQSLRAIGDLELSAKDIERQRGETTADYARQRQNVETGYGRNLSDLLTARTQAQEDYTTNLAALQRNYERLGSAQTQNARAAGVAAGGAFAQAAAKRAANQAIEKAPIDTSFNRFLEQSKLGQTRLGEDRQTTLEDLLTNETRAGEALTRQGKAQGLGYTRGAEDRAKQLERAEDEFGWYKRDLNTAKIAQAVQMGWKPGTVKSAPFLPGEKKKKGKGKGKGGTKVGELLGGVTRGGI